MRFNFFAIIHNLKSWNIFYLSKKYVYTKKDLFYMNPNKSFSRTIFDIKSTTSEI